MKYANKNGLPDGKFKIMGRGLYIISLSVKEAPKIASGQPSGSKNTPHKARHILEQKNEIHT